MASSEEQAALSRARFEARGGVKAADGKYYYTANGTTARSLAALCRELSVDLVRVRERMRRGWTLEQAINLPVGARLPSEKYLVDPEENRRVLVASQMRDVLGQAWAGDAHATIIEALKIGAAYLKGT